MKKADIKKLVGTDTVVAVSVSNPRKNEVPGSVVKCVVVDIDQTRRVFSGARYDMHGHIVDDGVRVRAVDRDPPTLWAKPIVGSNGYHDKHEETDDRVVNARQIIATYDDYVEIHGDALAERRAKKDAEDAREQRHADASRLINEMFGPFSASVGRYWPHNGKPTITGVTVRVDVIEKMIEICAESQAGSHIAVDLLADGMAAARLQQRQDARVRADAEAMGGEL